MSTTEMKGYFYKCQKCAKGVPLPDYIMKNIVVEERCPACNTFQDFKLSESGETCHKKMALKTLSILEQIGNGKIRFEAFWENQPQ